MRNETRFSAHAIPVTAKRAELTPRHEGCTVLFVIRVIYHIVLTALYRQGEDLLAGSLDWVRVSTDEGGRGPLATAPDDSFAQEEFFVHGVLREREM